MGTVRYTECPVCKSSKIQPLLTVIDQTVSGETFEVWMCQACTLRFTQGAPDESSIAPYYKSEAYISHTDSNKGVINQLYKWVRRYTLGLKAKLLVTHTGKPKGTLLDIGCGTGAFLNRMQQNGWVARGLEPNSEARDLASKLYGIEAGDITELFNLQPASFDAVTMWHVLEHVHQVHDYVEQISKLLKAGGRLFIAVPNYESLDADIYGSYWAAYDVPRHLYHFTPKAISALVSQHGMSVTAQEPMWFDAFYISMLSSKYQTGSIAYAGSLLNGLRSNLLTLREPSRCSSLIYVVSKS